MMSKDAIYGGAVIVLLGLLVISVFTQGFGLAGAADCDCPVCPDNEQVTQPTGNTNPPDTTETTENTTATTEENETVELVVTVGSLPVLGNANAPVTWVEFSDYQCPFCAKLYTNAEASVKTNYIDTGKVKLYFRDFPLSFHPNALPAAVAAGCANEQGKFWEMHEKLFLAQSSWSGLSNVDDTFKGYAVELGLDNATFSTCYDEASPIEAIGEDFADGQTYGVQGTPSNFLLIPKDKISEEKIYEVVGDLNSMYGGIGLAENEDEYILFIPGAYPYEAFDAIFSAVSY